MKVKFYDDYEQFEKDFENNEIEETNITVLRKEKYIDIDCYMTAKTPYVAFKKLKTALKKYNMHRDLEMDLRYKDDFYLSLNMYNREYPYPDAQKNGYYGYTIENCYDDYYYLRYFFPAGGEENEY